MDETVGQSLIYRRYRNKMWPKRGRKDYSNYNQEEETKLRPGMNKTI